MICFKSFLLPLTLLQVARSIPTQVGESENRIAPTPPFVASRESLTSHALFPALQEILSLDMHSGCELLYLYGTSASDVVSHYDLDTLQLNQYSSGQRTLSLFTPNLTYPRHEDIHRYTPTHCAVGIFMFNDFASSDNLQTWLFETMTPRYGPVIRKDEDHFVFLTPSQAVADTALLSPKFGEKIKYKMALHPLPSGKKEVVCKTVDFYANNDGGPLLRRLRVFQSSSQEEDDKNSINLSPDMTRDFNGHLFRITVPNVKYRFEMAWRDGSYHPKRGFYKWWLDEALRKFNFTYNMFWSSFEKATGKPLSNGTWVGAAGDLLYDRADIAVIVGETYSRQPFFGFSAVLSFEWFFFMTHKPWATYSPNAIFWPFSPLMWTLFFASLFVMTFSLRCITEWSTDPNSKNTKWTYGRMFDYIFTTFMEQDRDGPLSTSSIRMLCAFWLLFAMITSTAYRGSLVTLIAFPVDSWIPSTFEELASSNFKVALNNVGKVGAAYDMLSSSTNPIFQQLYQKMEMIGEPEVCLTKAMQEDMCCIIWEGIVQYANARNVSDRFGYVPMVQSKEIALFIGDGFTYERRAIFKHHMDRTIEAAYQMGLTIKWLDLDKEFIWKERKQWEQANNRTPVYYDRDEGPQKLVLSQFAGLYLLTLGGVTLASGQFVVELRKHKKAQAKQTKVQSSSTNHKEDTSTDMAHDEPIVTSITVNTNKTEDAESNKTAQVAEKEKNVT